ncbi:hypothetical protein ACFOQM_19075 [Paenibacillus sp. GCM10012307]|uniref:Uncharacterized protein n=1 Tax=Paenibacillus roseus TaxID=2798579 RepID=A0A934MQM6_9BACL|nr:hypothetical protein [Paenibacillus roseus]MBJ6363326.1 hypothetical protein [Paenibacillus roseus]
MSALYFMLFSTIEGMSLFSIMLSLFRYRITEYFQYYVVLSILMSGASYWMWQISGASEYVPVLSALLFSLSVLVRYRLSPMAAMLMALTGYFFFGMLQSLVVYALEVGFLIRMERIQGNTSDTYLMQSVNSLLLFALSYTLYRKGFGFTFPLSWVEVKEGNTLLLSSLSVAFIFVTGVSLLHSRVYAAAAVFFLILLLLLYILNRKEQRHVRSLFQATRRYD